MEFSSLLSLFREAHAADQAAGRVHSPDTRATEVARSTALETLVHAVECPTCHAKAEGCTGKVAVNLALFGLDHELPLHRTRVDAVNSLARSTDGGSDPVVASYVQL